MKKLIIIGSGFHSKVVYEEILKLNNYKVLGYVSNDDKNKHSLRKLKYLGKLEILNKLKCENFYCVISVGQGNIREKICNEIKKLKIKIQWEKIISKNSIISSNTKIGEGSVVVSGSIINTGTKIGRHCLINTGSYIDHDNIFKDFSGCGPRTTTGGNVTLGERSYIGIGSVIKNNIIIQKDTVIGASSLVLQNCKKNTIYYGNPAKKKKGIKKKMKIILNKLKI